MTSTSDFELAPDEHINPATGDIEGPVELDDRAAAGPAEPDVIPEHGDDEEMHINPATGWVETVAHND
ncbi:MAG: hypothetical protein JWR82_1889 [Blastococcus sp.]|nr:hypothetical protein [Blastococcus sp.]